MDPDELLARSADELLARSAVTSLLERYEAGEREFGAIDLSEVHLSNVDLCGIDLGDADLSHAKLYGVNLSHSNLSNANLNGAQLYGVNLYGVNLGNADLQGVDLSDVNLSYTNLSEADFAQAYLGAVNLSGSDLSCANFSHANLTQANLSEADLSCANFSDANLNRANLTCVTQEFNEVTLDAPRQSIDFTGANLTCANLTQADLSHADFRGADLQNAILVGTKLMNAFLERTNLSGTSLDRRQKIIEIQNSQECAAQTPIQNRSLIQQIAILQSELKRQEIPAEEIQMDGSNAIAPSDGNGNRWAWEQLQLSSIAQVEIAKALDRANLLFFGNSIARLDLGGVRGSETELGFLVFNRVSVVPTFVRWGILAVDSPLDKHEDRESVEPNRDIYFERGGVRIYRFPYLQCLQTPDRVVQKFIELLALGK
ncbi:pentapeptide repeat-containing protein [Oscillatoriales cyanobacterium LEGE 11467]|uniref:Pentapeptide repeat-containing protein n=1 Tax=Zarconia navalis LEGE 11467 TaxID=1828826 RepID=A0A928W064_9CYAN|nr:pentapeptide repeat-containing protein [Zarconia navalis]MBE9042062.1 pentapeptide repeat-containing protein [Zarconia navalis LEGE 11467]